MEPMSIPALNGLHLLVAGLGKSGRSAVEFCRKQGATVSVSDAAQARPDDLAWLTERGIAHEFGGHGREFCLGHDLILASPGVPHDLPLFREATEAGIPVIGELALAPRYLRTPVIAITGTNGKTTVTTLIGDLLRASGMNPFVGGNIGTPLTDYLLTEQTADWLVLEVSSFQLDAAGDFRPEIGILLNLSPDHLDRYPSYDAYALAKLNLFAHQRPGDVAILNGDDLDTARLTEGYPGLRPGWQERRCLHFGRALGHRPGAELTATTVELKGEGLSGTDESYPLRATALASSPNLENAAAAILAVRMAGGAAAAIKQGLAAFTPLPHRMTVAAEVDGVRYINDSKATNIGAVQAALAAMDQPVILIAGGRDKGGDYLLMAGEVKSKVKTCS